VTELPVKLPTRVRLNFAAIYGTLIVVLVVAAFGAGVAGPWKVQPKAVTVTRTVAPAAGAALVAAWGTSDQTIDGAQVSQGLAGTTCAVYRSRKTVVCYAP
jgi:hypothetical protein